MIDTNLHILDTIFETLPSGLILFRPDGSVVKLNLKAKTLLDMESSTRLEHLQELPEYLSPLKAMLMEASADVQRSEITVQLPSRPDEESTLGFSLKNIKTPEGSLIRALTFTDITQILKDRLAMEKIKEELNQSKKLASIGTMISGVAHELNNPLTGISMSTELTRMTLERLKKKLDPQTDANTLEALEKALNELAKITRSSEKAAVLVGDLLSYSKPTRLELKPASLTELVAETVNAFRTQPKFAQFTFKLEIPETRWLVKCDWVKLEQVFFNLIRNACDATEGTGILEIFFEETLSNEGKPFVTVHLKDNGPGIEKSAIERIFDPFFSTKGHGGVGLGLSISYRTVEQHGGLLSVESELDQGAEFKVMLPVYNEEESLEQ